MKKPSLFKSFQFAFNGIFYLIRTDRNVQIEIFGLLINLLLIVFLKLSYIDCILILIACFLVIMSEFFNSSIEKLADIIEPHYNPKIGLVKDIAAGAVVLMFVLSVAIAFLVYPKYINSYFQILP